MTTSYTKQITTDIKGFYLGNLGSYRVNLNGTEAVGHIRKVSKNLVKGKLQVDGELLDEVWATDPETVLNRWQNKIDAVKAM